MFEPPKPKPETFAKRLKKWRMGLKLVQKEAAAIFDVTPGAYKTWEYGKKTPNKLAMFEVERRMAAEVEKNGK